MLLPSEGAATTDERVPEDSGIEMVSCFGVFNGPYLDSYF